MPVKLTMAVPKSELADAAAEFTVNAKVDAKLFVLPKGMGRVPTPRSTR